ncbi:MAG: LPP20 family lipoprotein [bacterium]
MWIKLFLFKLLIISCLFATDPHWYLKHTEKKDYWLGYGSGQSLKQAQKEAQTNIATQLKVELDVNESFSQHYQNNKRMKQENKLSVKSRSKIKLHGLEILKQEESNNKVYVLLGLNKKNYKSQLINQYKQTYSQIQQVFKFTNKLTEQPFLRIEMLSILIQKYEQLKESESLLISLGSEDERKRLTFTPFDLELAIKQILQDIKLEIKEGNKQKVPLGQAPKQPIIFKLTYKNKALPNIDIDCKQAGQHKKEKTNQKGEIYYQEPMYPEESGTVIAKLHIKGIGALPKYKRTLLQNQLNIDAKAQVNITEALKQEVTCKLLIEGRDITNIDKKELKRKINQAFKDIGVKLKMNESSNLKIIVKVDTSSIFASYYRRIYECIANIEIRYKNKKCQFYNRAVEKDKLTAIEQGIKGLEITAVKLIKTLH